MNNKILVEETLFENPKFMYAKFYKFPVEKPEDLINNECVYETKLAIEAKTWPPENKVDIMFTSSAFDLFGRENFIVKKSSNLPGFLSCTIRKDEEGFDDWYIVLSERRAN